MVKKWPVEPGDYVLGKGNHVAVVELGNSEINIPEELYAIKGSLYTVNLGIPKLIKNVISNPNLTHLVLTGKDVKGFKPGQALLKLMEKGLNNKKEIIGAKGFRAHLKRISKSKVKRFKNQVEVLDFRGKGKQEVISNLKEIPEPEEIVKVKKQVPEKEKGIGEDLPNPEKTLMGTILVSENLKGIWEKTLRHIMLFGKIKKSERGTTKEVLTLIAKIKNPLEEMRFPGYDMGKEELEDYYQNSILSPEQGEAAYTYGSRIFKFGKLEEVASYLRDNKNTRRAVISLWNPEKDVGSKHPPCLDLIHLIIRKGRLKVTGFFRSHDMFGAAPSNWYGLAKLQNYIADRLGVEVGTLLTHSSSAHIYQRDWQRAMEICGRFPKEIKASGRGFKEDEMGYFIIKTKEGKIIVEHRNKNDEILYKVKGETAEEVRKEISALTANLRPDHYTYLGQELEKAEKAIENGKEYIQDSG